MKVTIRTKHILNHAGRINKGIDYGLKNPFDVPPITRMLAIHVLSEKEWCQLRNGGKISYRNLIGE